MADIPLSSIDRVPAAVPTGTPQTPVPPAGRTELQCVHDL